MAHDSRLTEWLQFETLVRYNLPAHISQMLYRAPAVVPCLYAPPKIEGSEEDYRATIQRLRKENEDLRAKLESREAELARLKALHSSSSGMRGSLGEEGAALLRDHENARLKAQINEDTLENLERLLAQYRDKIRHLEDQRKDPLKTFVRQFWPLRYRDESLELLPLLEQANSLDNSFWALIQASEATVSLLAGKFSPLAEDLIAKSEELKQVRNSLRSEPFTAKTYTPQEAAEKVSILIANAAAKEDLLRRYESLKRDLVSQWSELQLAKVITAQKEAASTAVANAYISAKEHNAGEDHLRSLSAIELTATEVSQSEAPMFDRCFALESQLLALANVHKDILSLSKTGESGHWDLEHLHAEQQKVADFSEETLEQLLHASGKPKDQLNSLKATRAKLTGARQGPLKPSDLLGLMQLQMEYERVKRDVFEQAKVRMEQLTEQDQEAQQRLRRVLEQSELDLATLEDLATRQESGLQKLGEDRRSAQNLAQLIAVDEEHQTMRGQFLKDVPHVLVTAGVLKSVLTAAISLRTDLKEKLRAGNQLPALESLSQLDALETQASDALESLLKADSKEAKERYFLSVLDEVSVLLSKQKEVQGAGLGDTSGAKKETETTWKSLLGTIDDLVSLLADGFHKLTIDDTETRAELETILENQKLLTPAEPKFEEGFQFTLEIVGAIKRMLSDTNNLTEVISELQGVYKNLVKFQQIMQDNYYKLKPVVGTEEIPGRRAKRGQTFLHISYAEPQNPKEGINILQDMISTLAKNVDNLFEIESKRVLVVENSLNIKRAQEGLARLQEIEKEEKRLRGEEIETLRKIAGEGVEELAVLAEQGLEPLEQIPNYAESITFFLKQVAPWLEKSLEFDQALSRVITQAAPRSA